MWETMALYVTLLSCYKYCYYDTTLPYVEVENSKVAQCQVEGGRILPLF